MEITHKTMHSMNKITYPHSIPSSADEKRSMIPPENNGEAK